MFSSYLTIIKYFLLLPLLIPYAIWDRKKNPRCKIFGIEGYFGLMGQGKTLSMTRRLMKLRKKYGSNIIICTNYNFKGQDFSFNDWHQLLKDYKKPLVVAWDEVQNEFSSRNFKNFPIELLTQLTQVRKNNGILILYSAQRWARVDKVFRELSTYCYQCTTHLGVFTINKKYRSDHYDQMCSSVSVDRKFKVPLMSVNSFIQTKEVRESYNSYKMLKTAKSKQYMSREELNRAKGV